MNAGSPAARRRARADPCTEGPRCRSRRAGAVGTRHAHGRLREPRGAGARASQGAGLAFVTEEALSQPVIDTLASWLQRQPPWSDFPFVVLATRARGAVAAPRRPVRSPPGQRRCCSSARSTRRRWSAPRARRCGRGRASTRRAGMSRSRSSHARPSGWPTRRPRAPTRPSSSPSTAAELGTFHCPWPFRKMVWNERCKTHFWLPADAAVDFDTFYSIIHPDDRARAHAAMEAAVAENAPYDVEYRAVSPEGQWRWIRAKGRVFRDANGQPTRFDGVTLDVSRQKQLEVEREILLGAERDARTQAERASRMKDEFLATLSHELRTPLSVDPRLDPPARAPRQRRRRHRQGGRDDRAQRARPGAPDRGAPRRQPHHLGQPAARHPPGRAGAGRRSGRSHR